LRSSPTSQLWAFLIGVLIAIALGTNLPLWIHREDEKALVRTCWCLAAVFALVPALFPST
jgi:hypothetical protein